MVVPDIAGAGRRAPAGDPADESCVVFLSSLPNTSSYLEQRNELRRGEIGRRNLSDEPGSREGREGREEDPDSSRIRGSKLGNVVARK